MSACPGKMPYAGKPTLKERLVDPDEQDKLWTAIVKHGSVYKAVKELKMDESAVWRFARDNREFGRLLDIARQVAADKFIDKVADILEEKTTSLQEVNDKRNRIDGYLRLAGKMNQKYADRPTNQVNIQKNTVQLVDEETRARLQALQREMLGPVQELKEGQPPVQVVIEEGK